MKDRISTKILENGAIRYGIYDEAGNLLRYEYIRPEDEPTEPGSAINKANLLPDDVATALGLTGNPQVKDALKKMGSNFNNIKYVQLLSMTAGMAAQSISLDLSRFYMPQYANIQVFAEIVASERSTVTCTISNVVSTYCGTYISKRPNGLDGYVEITEGAKSFGKFDTFPPDATTPIALDIAHPSALCPHIFFRGGYNPPVMGQVVVLHYQYAGLTSIQFSIASGTINSGSKFFVYGVKK